jgi:hypothetical protein
VTPASSNGRSTGRASSHLRERGVDNLAQQGENKALEAAGLRE